MIYGDFPKSERLQITRGSSYEWRIKLLSTRSGHGHQSGWSPIACKGFHTKKKHPSSLPTTLVLGSFCRLLISIGSMYAIYGSIYHQYAPNVSIYVPGSGSPPPTHGHGTLVLVASSNPPSPCGLVLKLLVWFPASPDWKLELMGVEHYCQP